MNYFATLVQRKKPVRFPVKRVGTLAACLAVCAVGYGAFATGRIGLGAKSSSPAAYYSADSTAAVMAAKAAWKCRLLSRTWKWSASRLPQY